MEFLKKYKIKTKQLELYKTAFTHTSYANEEAEVSYERLEFLGDAVLELIISEYLYKTTDFEEGVMTKMRAHYVNENALYEYAIHLKMNEDILLGKGEEEQGGKYRKAILADVFESFLGALFLDQGLVGVKRFIYNNVIPLMKDPSIELFTDYKSLLQEQVQTDKRSLEYVLTEEKGPSHKKEFTVIVKIDNIVYGQGTAHSKKQAEQEAAKDALNKSAKAVEK